MARCEKEQEEEEKEEIVNASLCSFIPMISFYSYFQCCEYASFSLKSFITMFN